MTEILSMTSSVTNFGVNSRANKTSSRVTHSSKTSMLMNEDELVKLAQQQDHQAFAALLQHYDRQIMNVILRFTGNQFDRDDLYQDIFTACYASLPKFSGRSKFFTWLYRIALNYCVDYKKKNVPTLVDVDTVDSTRTDWEQRGKISAISYAMNGLEGPQQISFHLFYIEQWSIDEIVQVLDCSPGTVKSNLDRARKKIRLNKEVIKWMK